MIRRQEGGDPDAARAHVLPERLEQAQALGIPAEAREPRPVGGGPVHGVLLDLARRAPLKGAVVDETAVSAQRLTIAHRGLRHDERLRRASARRRPAPEQPAQPPDRIAQHLVGDELLRAAPAAERGVDRAPAAASEERVDLAGQRAPAHLVDLRVEDPGIEGKDRALGNLVLAPQDLPQPDVVLDGRAGHAEVVERRGTDADQRAGHLHHAARAERHDARSRDGGQSPALEAALVHVAIAEGDLAGTQRGGHRL